jgi:ribokinase
VTPPRVVVAGNLSLDDTVNPTGSFEAAPGGDALYASLAVRGWGGDAVLLTVVGDDYPAAHLDAIARAGVDLSHVRSVAGPTVHYRVTNAADDSRRYEWISAPERLLATSPTRDDYGTLDRPDWVHVAAMPIEAQEWGVAAARDAGVPFSLDPHEEEVARHAGRVRRMVDGAAFMPSELEVGLLFADLGPGYGDDPVTAAGEAARRLDAWRPALVAIKLGANGSTVRHAGQTWHVPALPARVVDPTGAGDAYCGGFVVGWLATGDPRIAAACGTVSAAETVGSFGAFPDSPMPASVRLERLDSLLHECAPDDADASALRAAAAPLRALLATASDATASEATESGARTSGATASGAAAPGPSA